MTNKTEETFYPQNPEDWRNWLSENHERQASVWLIFPNKKSDKNTLSWSETVDEALCFGWIDSKKQTLDAFTYRQFYTKRKPNSIWSKVNKEKVEQLIENGKMQPAGLKCIEVAKQNGAWTFYDAVEDLIIPDDLQKALENHTGALEYFEGLSKSNRKILLYWIVSAKRPDTRQNRIDEIAKCASQGQKPKQFR